MNPWSSIEHYICTVNKTFERNMPDGANIKGCGGDGQAAQCGLQK